MPAGVGVPTTAVPLIATVCGLPLASSMTLTVAVRFPAPVGPNVTAIAQLASTPTAVLVQVFVCEKSPAFVPVSAMPEMFSAADPVLVTVHFGLHSCCPHSAS